MSENLNPIPVDDEQALAAQQKREANKAVIETYLGIKGADAYEERLNLMAVDVMYEIVNTMDCMPERTVGINKVGDRFKKNALYWDEFEYKNIRIIETHDPEIYFVECDAEGTMFSPMYKEPRPYSNYYYIMFVMRDNQILKLRQFSNPQKILHDYWNKLPNSAG